jgi:hypothetical protein
MAVGPFIRISWGGSFDGEEEIWSNNLNFSELGSQDPDAADVLSRVNTEVSAAIQAFHTNVDVGISNRCRLEWIKYAIIGSDFKYIGDAAVYDFPTPINGGSTGSIETQRSLAVSFKTAVTRGPSSNGRFYIPAYRLGVGTNGRVTTTDQEDLLAAAITFVDDLNFAVHGAGYPAHLSVVSQVNGGSFSWVEKVRIGDVIDSQRRRKNKMKEIYVEGNLA